MDGKANETLVVFGLGRPQAPRRGKARAAVPKGRVDAEAALLGLAGNESWAVRAAAADAGCGLDALLVDDNPYVRQKACAYLKRSGLSLVEWMEANPGLVTKKKQS